MALRTSLLIAGEEQGAIAALGAVERGLEQTEQAAKRAGAAANDAGAKIAGSTRAAQAGAVNLGRQVQDVAVQLQSGTNLGTIVAQQGGQVADALAQMGGRFGGLASFLAGPWGAAIIVGTGVLLNTLIPALFSTGDAADDTKADVLNLSGSLSGLATNAEIAGKALADLRASMAQTSKASEAANAAVGSKLNALGAAAKANRDIARDKALIESLARTPGGARGLEAAVGRLRGSEKAKAAADKAIRDADDQLEEIAGLAVVAQIQQRNKDRLNKKPKAAGAERARKGPDAAAQAARQAEFGEDIAARIAGVKDQFSDLPAVIAHSNRALRQLDDIANDIDRKKLPQSLKDGFADARKVIQESLLKPFDEYLEKSREVAAIDALLIAGRDDEAEALQRVLVLQKGMATETQLQQRIQELTNAGRLAEAAIVQGILQKQRELPELVLATVRAERDRALVLRDQRALIDANVDAVHDLRASLEGTVADLLTGKFSVKRILASIGNSAVTIISKRVVESAFGGFLRDLEKSATSKLDKAETKLAERYDTAGAAALDLAKGLREALDTLNGTSPADAIAGAASASPSGGSGPRADGSDPANDINVTANRLPENPLIDLVDGFLKKLNIEIPDALKKVLRDALSSLEKGLSETLGKLLQGAGTGVAVAQVGKLLGLKTSSTGGAIGGAIGQAIGGPIGSVVGSIIGSIGGGLLKKTKSGSATIGSANGTGAVTGTGGNSNSRIGAARGLAGSGLDALDRIVEALGGETGDFAASIGVRNKKFVVDPTGRGRTKGAGTQKFASEEEAAKALLADVIADGAVKGVSAAVQRALTSSPDVEKALKEALKVQDVEQAIGGIGAQLQRAFREFERTAAERLRIGKQYGFDLVKLEERNAKDRLKLTEQLLAEQVGGLQRLIDELTSGSLFEGSAVDRRQALLASIATAKTDADAGVEGAADKLSGLLEQLNAVSKDVFATTGGFAADRASIVDQARDTIARANQRIIDAQKGSDPALATTNATLDEMSDQNARMIAELEQNNAFLGAIAAQGAVRDFSNLANLARTSFR